MSKPNQLSFWRKVEALLESPTGYYTSMFIMLAISAAVLVVWYV